MDDTGAPPFDSAAIEILIFKGLKQNRPPELIADEVLKFWAQGQLSAEAKLSAGKFCFQEGFFASLLNTLRNDLRRGSDLPWPVVFQLISYFKKKIPKEVIDACLTGATRDNQLHGLAAEALKQRHSDGRWNKIFASELNDRLGLAKEKRENLMEEVKFFKNERMEDELKAAIGHLLSMFPEDTQVKSLALEFGEVALDRALFKLRHQSRRARGTPLLENEHSPDITRELKNLEGQLNVEEVYHLSIGLHEMGLSVDALEVLRWQKSKWKIREEIWELELLNAQRRYAESLSLAQTLMRRNEAEPDVVREALYHAAKAYHGLEDLEQATSILRGIVRMDPHYRDAAVLLAEWETQTV